MRLTSTLVWRWLLGMIGLAAAQIACADLTVLSGGAIEAGLRPAVTQFEQQTSTHVVLRFATAPEIRRRLLGGEAVDLVIAPPAVLDDLARSGRLSADPAERQPVGSVAIGVAVRTGHAAPDTTSGSAFTSALRTADEIVYNRASTGLEVEALFGRLGLDAELAPKTTRYADGASVMRRVIAADGHAIGIGAVTEILPFRAQGLQFVGLLPEAWQKRTAYVAAALVATPETRTFLDHLASPGASQSMRDAGVEPPP